MIDKWLKASRRVPSGFSFDVTDLHEDGNSIPPPSYFASLLREAYWGEQYIADLAGTYGWRPVRDRFLKARAGTGLRVRRGDFGEAIAAGYLTQTEQYQVPVLKLRFKMGSNQTLPGTDCIAIKADDSQLREVCYVESKLRSTRKDLSVAIAGASQLKHDADAVVPEVLTFITRHMRETQHPLANLVERYIFSRETGLDSFKLIVFHEKDLWEEQILQNLEDEEIQLAALCVYVALIARIADVSDAAFRKLGAVEIIDDDN